VKGVFSFLIPWITADEVLKYLSTLIKKETRESDLCFRMGEEEFLIVLPETDIGIAKTIEERIRKKTENTISPSGKPITVSIGIGNSPETAKHFSQLINATDKALYQAKQEGRNRRVIADSKNQ
jgi:diguanylate cyclase (GGDEF)-like protein